MTCTLSTEEPDAGFLKRLKAAFPRRMVTIAVNDKATEEDRTAYLLKSPANRNRLLKAVADAKAGKNLITVMPEQLARWK
jgi:hypothetical protein